MKLYEFIAKMNELAPFDSCLEWDNVGLLVGDKDAEVSKVYICLDVDLFSIDAAIKSGADLILSHHPMLFRAQKRIVAGDLQGDRIIKLIKNNINYIAMHTNYDVHVMGDICTKQLGISEYSVLDITENEDLPRGIGTIYDMKVPDTLENIASIVKTAFNLPFVSFFGEAKASIKRVAIVPGSGKSEIHSAIMEGADLLITGDITHHEGIDAVCSGLCIIDAGHYGLERIFVDNMQAYIKKNIKEIEVVTEGIHFPRRVV